MIEEAKCDCIIIGNFNEKNILISPVLKVVRKVIKGQVILEGRHKNKTAEESNLTLNGTLNNILDFLILNKRKVNVKRLSFLSITLTIRYSGQCNFELSAEELYKITQLKISLGISCYSDSKEGI